MQKFKVKWAHLGDRAYKAGDTREANPNAVKHLVKSGILEPMTDDGGKKVATKKSAPKKKSMPVEKNKAMPASDKNKAGTVKPLTNERNAKAAPKAKRKGFFGKGKG